MYVYLHKNYTQLFINIHICVGGRTTIYTSKNRYILLHVNQGNFNRTYDWSHLSVKIKKHILQNFTIHARTHARTHAHNRCKSDRATST